MKVKDRKDGIREGRVGSKEKHKCEEERKDEMKKKERKGKKNNKVCDRWIVIVSATKKGNYSLQSTILKNMLKEKCWG